MKTIQKIIRESICWLVGCKHICIHKHVWENGDGASSTTTGWKCVRCYNYTSEQWDT